MVSEPSGRHGPGADGLGGFRGDGTLAEAPVTGDGADSR
jgi:hypothetical protein